MTEAVLTVATAPFNIGWQKIVLIFLIVAILAGPGLVALGIVVLVLRHRRKRRGYTIPRSTPR